MIQQQEFLVIYDLSSVNCPRPGSPTHSLLVPTWLCSCNALLMFYFLLCFTFKIVKMGTTQWNGSCFTLVRCCKLIFCRLSGTMFKLILCDSSSLLSNVETKPVFDCPDPSTFPYHKYKGNPFHLSRLHCNAFAYVHVISFGYCIIWQLNMNAVILHFSYKRIWMAESQV